MAIKKTYCTLFNIFVLFLFSIVSTQATETISAETAPICACDPVTDSLILVSIFNSTNGDQWLENTNWLEPGQPIDTWHGVTVNEAVGGCVSRLELANNQLSGTLPAEIGYLTSLTRLTLSENQIGGSIPSLIGNLSELTRLRLNNNLFTGQIPAFLGNLNNLTELRLFNNQLTGPIPLEIGNLINLIELKLFNNELTGPIPPEIGNLLNITILNLSNNELSGAIPPEIGNLQNLVDLFLSRNQLSGAIPIEINNLENLNILKLEFNQLEGLISSEIELLQNLSILDLSSNNLSGIIPPEIGNLQNLTYLLLANNNLSGNIPLELGNLQASEIILDHNDLSGCFPIDLLDQQCNITILFTYHNPQLPWEGDIFQLCNSTLQIGAPCDDGDPNTFNDVIQPDCSCGSSNYKIKGSVFADFDENCDNSPQEQDLENWIIKATGEQTYFGYTDESGNYEIKVDTGIYQVSIIQPNAYWSPCLNDVTVAATTPYDSTTVDFSVQPVYFCPLLDVEISTPFLRRCFANVYTVTYCNQGTVAEENAVIDITLDPFIELETSSIAWSEQNENTYTFPIGFVDVGECGSIILNTYLDCDSTILGQTHCVEAHAMPDSICLPEDVQWDGSEIELEVFCENDSIHFIIKNVGNDMSDSLTAIVIEDEFMFRVINFDLDNNEEKEVVIYAEAGSSYRMETMQAIGHPIGNMPSASIEGCAGFGDNPILGTINNYAQDDIAPFIDIDCQESIGSYDPNDKNGFPEGVGDQYEIAKETKLTYHIRFQNTGTDTAFTVVIADTLSSFLDINTFEPGLSSHQYEWEFINPNILKFHFNNILLPDSTTNELGSQGFLRFDIMPHQSVNAGTVIENSAAIFFDFNPPIITNTKYYTITDPEWHYESTTLNACEQALVNDEYITNDITLYNDTTHFQYYTVVDLLHVDIHQNVTTEIDSLVTYVGDSPLHLQTMYSCDSIIHVNYLIDQDGDGFSEEEDCNDQDAAVNPDAEEISNNEIDENCDGLLTAIKEVDTNTINVFPIPFEDRLSLSCTCSIDGFYQLFDTRSSMVQSGTLSFKNNGTIIIQDELNNGLYFLKIITEKGELIYTQKVIKKNH